MSTVTDPNDPRLGRGVDEERVPQHEVYLVLSEEERAKGFVRPLRMEYKHVGRPDPRFALVDLTDDQAERYAGAGYVKFEPYPESESPKVGRFWTQAELDAAGTGGCGTVTTLVRELAETYAREPHFYGATYCVHCAKHLAVSEFVWLDGERVGS